jgi:inorganic pyrophosphatase
MERRPDVSPRLSDIPTYDQSTGELRAVIETPKGSHNKYDYTPELDCFRLNAVLPEGMVFPYDFGFIPSTLGEDGDPMDVLVLLDFPVIAGCMISVRLIGVIEAEQREKGQDWYRNDRLVAVASLGRVYGDVRSLEDLRPDLLKNVKAFFQNYNKLRDREFKPLGEAQPDKATQLVKEGMAKFRNGK